MKVLSNVEACVRVGGCVLAVDFLTMVHEASERTAIPLQSNLIAASAFMEPLKEWMFLDKNGAQVGPVEKDAIRRFWSRKEIDWTTRCWASGMPEWKRLRDIRELRWALAIRVPVLNPVQVNCSKCKKFFRDITVILLMFYGTRCCIYFSIGLRCDASGWSFSLGRGIGSVHITQHGICTFRYR